MTVQELLDTMPCCDLVEIVVRKTGHGQWIQGYRVGKNAMIYPSEVSAEIRELKGMKEYHSHRVDLEEGEIVDVKVGFHLPMKVICKDCHKLPDHIGRLEVCSVQPRHIPFFHNDQLTHNEFSLNINCYPDCFIPDRFVEARETKRIPDTMNQLSFDDFYGKELTQIE